MPDSCSLWVNLASAGPRAHSHAEPTAYLYFPSTGLVVGLPDEPGLLVDPAGSPTRFALREADAAGLGLSVDDLTRGVAFCCGNEHEPGWRCDPIELVVNDAEGEVHFGASATGEAIAPRAQAAPDEPAVPTAGRPFRPRALVYVNERGLGSGALVAAAARAHELDAHVVLGAVGELPESRRHAAEETQALHRLLAFAAPLFGGRVAALRVELGGDPVHGLLTLAAEEHANLILVPEDAAARSQVEGLARRLRRGAGIPVESVVAHAAADSRAGVPRPAGSSVDRERVVRRLTIAIGDRDDTPPWERPEAWARTVRAAVHERVRRAPPVPAGAQCTLTARWFVHPDHPRPDELQSRLPIETIARALAEESYLMPAHLPPGSISSEVVEMDPDLVEHVVAVLRC